MSRQRALVELMCANPLWRHLGRHTPLGFYAIVLERELVRIRRHRLQWPREWWSAHWIFQRIRLTNVKRAEDRCSRAVASAGAPLKMAWQGAVAPGCDADIDLHKIGKCIFTIALWRSFGTPLAVSAIGPQLKEWSAMRRYDVVESLVEAALRRDASSEEEAQEIDFCFTSAYGPARENVRWERSCVAKGDRKGLRDLYMAACSGPVSRLLGESTQRGIARAALKGPRALTEVIMTVPQFGGTGFTAKEIVEDVKMLGLIRSNLLEEDRGWAMPGPGARRGCNRLAGRSVFAGVPKGKGKGARKESYPNVYDFQMEMRLLWRERMRILPIVRMCSNGRRDTELLLEADLIENLDCNDVQFQLCEADKFWRAAEAEACNSLPKVLEYLAKKGLRAFKPSSSQDSLLGTHFFTEAAETSPTASPAGLSQDARAANLFGVPPQVVCLGLLHEATSSSAGATRETLLEKRVSSVDSDFSDLEQAFTIGEDDRDIVDRVNPHTGNGECEIENQPDDTNNSKGVFVSIQDAEAASSPGAPVPMHENLGSSWAVTACSATASVASAPSVESEEEEDVRPRAGRKRRRSRVIAQDSDG